MTTSPAARGLLVVLEGIDGAGKSSVQRALLRRWKAEGLRTVGHKEPTVSELGRRAIRAAPTDAARAAMYFTLDRILARPKLDQLLREGRIVVQDRSYYSTLAYQGSALPPAQRRDLSLLQKSVAVEPDLVVLLDIPPKRSLRRVRKRNSGLSAIERSGAQGRVVREYRRLARQGNWVVVDASEPLRKVIEMTEAAIRAKLRSIGRGNLGRSGSRRRI